MSHSASRFVGRREAAASRGRTSSRRTSTSRRDPRTTRPRGRWRPAAAFRTVEHDRRSHRHLRAGRHRNVGWGPGTPRAPTSFNSASVGASTASLGARGRYLAVGQHDHTPAQTACRHRASLSGQPDRSSPSTGSRAPDPKDRRVSRPVLDVNHGAGRSWRAAVIATLPRVKPASTAVRAHPTHGIRRNHGGLRSTANTRNPHHGAR